MPVSYIHGGDGLHDLLDRRLEGHLRARLGSSQGRFNLLKHSSIGDKSGEYGGK